MAEEIKKQTNEKEIEASKKLGSLGTEAKPEEKKEESSLEKTSEKERKEEKKKIEVKKIKKDYALVNGKNISLSPKYACHICKMIRYKNVDTAIKMLEEVTQMRRVVKMNNREVGHKHGPGIMAGRYPINACKEFIRLLKQLKANGIYHELDIDNAIISECYANVASKPYRRGGARFKRTHLTLRLEKKKTDNKKNSNNHNKRIKSNKGNKSKEKKA